MPDPLKADLEKTKRQNKTTLGIILGIAGVFVILCGLVVLGIIYYVYGRPYFGPKIQIILEPDTSQVSTVKRADLEAAAKILTARCRALGVSGCSFTAAENNQIIGRMPGSADVETILKPTVATGLLEFVDFGEMPIEPGKIVRTDFAYPYFPPAEGEIWHTVMTNDGFGSAYVMKDQIGKPAVSFTLTPEGAKIFADFTSRNVGHYLGIVLDKVVISSPVINSPITAGNGIIQGSFTQEEAETLATYLTIKGPLPLPLVIKEVIKASQ